MFTFRRICSPWAMMGAFSLVILGSEAFMVPTAQLRPGTSTIPATSLRKPLRYNVGAHFDPLSLTSSRRNVARFMSEDYRPGYESEEMDTDAGNFVDSSSSEETFSVSNKVEQDSGFSSPVDAIKGLLESASTMSEGTATWWLMFVVAISGVNFGIVKHISEVFDSPTQITFRFFAAALALSPWLFSASKKAIPSGLESGAWLAAGYIAQAVSLAGGTPSSICSFFASLSCIVCPFFETIFGVRLDRKAWFAAALAIAGAGVLELGGGTMPTPNDFIALLQPVLFGIYLLRTEDAMEKSPKESMEITALQVTAVSILAGAWGLAGAAGAGALDFSQVGNYLQQFVDHPDATAGLVYMGLVPSAFALAIETVVLAKLSSSKTSLLFSTEPVFAAIFGGMFLGENIGANVVVGGLLATSACLVRSLDAKDVKEAYRSATEKLKEATERA